MQQPLEYRADASCDRRFMAALSATAQRGDRTPCACYLNGIAQPKTAFQLAVYYARRKVRHSQRELPLSEPLSNRLRSNTLTLLL